MKLLPRAHERRHQEQASTSHVPDKPPPPLVPCTPCFSVLCPRLGMRAAPHCWWGHLPLASRPLSLWHVCASTPKRPADLFAVCLATDNGDLSALSGPFEIETRNLCTMLFLNTAAVCSSYMASLTPHQQPNKKCRRKTFPPPFHHTLLECTHKKHRPTTRHH